MKKRQKGAILKKGRVRLPLARKLVESLIAEGQITTNLAWAKAVQPEIDRLINLVRRENVGGVRKAASFLRNKRDLVKRLKNDIVPKMEERVSGFTRVVRVREQRGDGVVLGKLSWVVEVEKMKPLLSKRKGKEQEKQEGRGEREEKK